MVFFYLLPFQVAAVICDLYERKIPNALITSGLIMGGAYQWSSKGISGLAEFAGGVILPILLLGILHYFRMIGAGDIKLFMMTGGFLGLAGSLKCICYSFLAAGLYATAVIIKYRVLGQRLRYFLQYVKTYCREREWKPYIMPQEKGIYLYFSIPVFIGSLAVMGGIF